MKGAWIPSDSEFTFHLTCLQIHSLMHLFVLLLIHCITHLLHDSVIHSSNNLFVYSFLHLCVYLSIPLWIFQFILSFTKWQHSSLYYSTSKRLFKIIKKRRSEFIKSHSYICWTHRIRWGPGCWWRTDRPYGECWLSPCFYPPFRRVPSLFAYCCWPSPSAF